MSPLLVLACKSRKLASGAAVHISQVLFPLDLLHLISVAENWRTSARWCLGSTFYPEKHADLKGVIQPNNNNDCLIWNEIGNLFLWNHEHNQIKSVDISKQLTTANGCFGKKWKDFLSCVNRRFSTTASLLMKLRPSTVKTSTLHFREKPQPAQVRLQLWSKPAGNSICSISGDGFSVCGALFVRVVKAGGLWTERLLFCRPPLLLYTLWHNPLLGL